MTSSLFFEPNFDPVMLKIGPLAIHWYGFMYILALFVIIAMGSYRAKQPDSGWKKSEVSDLAFYLFLGAVLGGRIGYTLFYQFETFIHNPLYLLGITENGLSWAGMSFHGGLLGVIIAALFATRKFKKSFAEIADFIAPLAPIGLLLGRLGNFINSELWGKPTDQTWGFLFHTAPDYLYGIYRHPSMLYEAALEGFVLFLILWIYTRKPRPAFAPSALFLMGYGIFRFIVEFYREPDAHLGYLAGDWLTMGMILCIPMILGGALLFIYAYRGKHDAAIS
ncbi:MAG: prolipoprotein diacylglyceryl transferase [Xanthomonadaceae bacterium]|nr:prolipoprotein diacylglyceryl transferase [Xanthomonadaceae bacterium]